jgi:hypothetical protein
LFGKGNRNVLCKAVKMTDNGAANFPVRGGAGPEVWWCSAGNTRESRKRRHAKLLVFLDEETRPVPQVLEQPVELSVQTMVLRDLSVGLLYLLDDVDNLIQDLIESSDGIVR